MTAEYVNRIFKNKDSIRDIINAHKRSFDNNPHYNAVISSAPTVTTGTLTSGVSNAYVANISNVLQVSPFAFYGGTPNTAKYTDYVVLPNATKFSTGGSVGGGLNSSWWRAAIVTDSPKVSFGVLGGSKYRIIIDKQYLSLTVTDFTSNSGLQYINLDFTSVGGAKRRVIQVEGMSACGVNNVTVLPSYKAWQPPASKLMIVVGDSLAEGTGATFFADNYAAYLGDVLGIPNTWSSGAGGSGYTATSSGTVYTFAQRISDWTSKSPDIIVFEGGINDADDTTLQPAVLLLLQNTRAALPYTLIVVSGIFPGNGGPSSATVSKEGKISAAVTAFGDPRTIFVPVSTDAGGSFVTGTGKIGTTTGVGNADIAVIADGTHPSDYGHPYYGERLANGIIKGLLNLL